MNYTQLPLAIGIDPIKKAFLDAKTRSSFKAHQDPDHTPSN
jgi:hypothetical protein